MPPIWINANDLEKGQTIYLDGQTLKIDAIDWSDDRVHVWAIGHEKCWSFPGLKQFPQNPQDQQLLPAGLTFSALK